MRTDISIQARKRLGIFGFILCLVVLPGSPPRAFGFQDLESGFASTRPSPAVIRISSNLVTVPVSVTDASGRIIRGLKIDDFRIAENGNPETVSKITETNPLALRLVLLFDLSGSVRSRFEFEQRAALRFLEKTWRPGDSVSVVAFNENTNIRLRDSDSLADAIQSLSQLEPTQSSTAFFDSVVLSASVLEKFASPETRQALIVISDGADNRSDHGLADTLQKVRNSDTVFYAINPGGTFIRLNEINRRGQENLAALANATGGAVFAAEDPAGLEDGFHRIAMELRAQYLLGYYSSNCSADGQFRRIDVSIPEKPDLSVRARHGYYALRK
jgi:Ca-activated chloride channel family protein